jgi:hypothetical protein
MGNEAKERRAELITHAENHADPMVREAMRVVIQEVVVLRGLVGGKGLPALTLSRRQLLGRLLAIVVLVAGLALAVVMAMHDDNAAAFTQGIADGYRTGTPPRVESIATPIVRPREQLPARRMGRESLTAPAGVTRR